MRRKDREITDIDKIETIIASARYMHLGMFDGEFPYIVPLHYGYQMEKGKLTCDKSSVFNGLRRI